MHACRQGLAIAQDSGNRFNESILANLARLEAREAVTVAAFDHLTLAVRNYHDSGNVASLRSPLAASVCSWIVSDASNRRPRSPVLR